MSEEPDNPTALDIDVGMTGEPDLLFPAPVSDHAKMSQSLSCYRGQGS